MNRNESVALVVSQSSYRFNAECQYFFCPASGFFNQPNAAGLTCNSLLSGISTWYRSCSDANHLLSSLPCPPILGGVLSDPCSFPGRVRGRFLADCGFHDMAQQIEWITRAAVSLLCGDVRGAICSQPSVMVETSGKVEESCFRSRMKVGDRCEDLSSTKGRTSRQASPAFPAFPRFGHRSIPMIVLPLSPRPGDERLPVFGGNAGLGA